VNDLTLTARKGQIMVLLGANGSGKSTTLDAIAGLNTVTSGSISVDTRGGLGYAPQKNVLWNELTVEEHVEVFNKLKAIDKLDTKEEMHDLIKACDMDRKVKAKAKTLSGGQKRKLQLAMMFTGGSRVCCVDEVSSGLDPLSRRKIWDILLAERGARTIIFTTHFLDEADLLSDHIAILSKGTLRAEGSAAELKSTLGGGYRVHLYAVPGNPDPPVIEGVSRKQLYEQTVYSVPDSAAAATVIKRLEAEGIDDYQVSGPTIEDVFLKLAEEAKSPNESDVNLSTARTGDTSTTGMSLFKDDKASGMEECEHKGLTLITGRRIGFGRQAWVLFGKRLTILRRNYLPYTAAFLFPIIAAGLVTLFLKGFNGAGCTIADQIFLSLTNIESFLSQQKIDIVVGPSDRLNPEAFSLFESLVPNGISGGSINTSYLLQSIHTVDTLDEFNNYINQNYGNVTPGGFFLSDPPVFAYKGNGGIESAIFTQNAMDMLLTNMSITTQYSFFNVPWAPNTGKTLQLTVYFGLAMACYPAFFALYPTVERLRNVRALQYSNGVRALPLWLAYLTFDAIIGIVASAIAIIIFAVASSVWYHIGYLFVVFLVYALSSILLSYVVSMFAKSQLAAFALAAAYQAVMVSTKPIKASLYQQANNHLVLIILYCIFVCPHLLAYGKD